MSKYLLDGKEFKTTYDICVYLCEEYKYDKAKLTDLWVIQGINDGVMSEVKHVCKRINKRSKRGGV